MSKLYPCKKSISRQEYYQIIGLLLIAQRKIHEAFEIEKMLREIIGQEGDKWHVSDAIHNDYTAEELLGKMKISVKDADSTRVNP